MTEREQRLIVSRALDVGERMLLCGGEVSRVEDTIYRILKSYGASRVEVFTILSFISLTAVFDAEQVYTENRRVSIVAYSNDFARLEQLNSLSREICQTTPGLDELTERLAAIDLPPRKKQFRELYAMVGYLLSGGAFALFFGGSPLDALGAGVCCLAVWFLNWFFRRSALQRLFHAFLISFIAGALCYLVILLGLGEHPGQLMMAVIMVLIPGIAMTNAMREMLISDTISGILRLVESLLIASAVAFGFALAMFVFKDYFPEEHFTSLNAELPWLQVLAAAAGTLGF
ncbi:MAG: threonine/serine exporter family protein, partial [Clostridia bacterium]|nr:threonine/serine exporter family protein [Clostridia bacterium]